MAFQRSVSTLGFVDLSHRSAPTAFAKRPTSMREIAAAGNELGIDVFFTPQYMWLAEEFISAKLPAEWSQVLDPTHGEFCPDGRGATSRLSLSFFLSLSPPPPTQPDRASGV